MTERSFAERLKRIRKRLHWSQAALAKALEVCGSTVAHWETDFSRPRMSDLENEDGLGGMLTTLEVRARKQFQREKAERVAREQAQATVDKAREKASA